VRVPGRSTIVPEYGPLPGVVAGLMLLAAPAGAADVQQAQVDRSGGGYRVYFEVVMRGAPGALMDMLTDYERLAALSPAVRDIQVEAITPGEPGRIEVTLRPCVLMVFCKTMVKVSEVFIDRDAGRIEYDAVPGQGDFLEARERVSVSAEGDDHVRFSYRAELRPGFSVPPFIGPWLIRRQILNELRATSRNAERAMQRADQRNGR